MENKIYKIEDTNSVLRIGEAGENKFRTITFDISAWTTVYPGGEILGVYRRPDRHTYPVPLRRIGNTAFWTVTDSDLAAEGYGELEIRIVKSSRFTCIVTESVDPGANPPAPGKDWIEKTIKSTAEAVQAAKKAKEDLLAAAERGDFDGAPGKDYVITEADKAEIIAAVLSNFTDVSEVAL